MEPGPPSHKGRLALIAETSAEGLSRDLSRDLGGDAGGGPATVHSFSFLTPPDSEVIVPGEKPKRLATKAGAIPYQTPSAR